MTEPEPSSIPTRTAAAVGLDLNLLPPRHRPRPVSIPGLLTVLLLVALLAMLLPAWQWFSGQATDYQSAVGEAQQLAQALQAGTQGKDLDAMATEAAALEARAAELEAALQGLGVRRLAWGEVLPRVLARTPAGIAYTDITDHESAVVLQGTSVDERQPLQLVRNLSDMGLFAAVQLEVLDRLEAESASPTPTATPRPRTTPTPIPTASTEEPEPRFQFTLTLVLTGGAP